MFVGKLISSSAELSMCDTALRPSSAAACIHSAGLCPPGQIYMSPVLSYGSLLQSYASVMHSEVSLIKSDVYPMQSDISSMQPVLCLFNAK